MVAEQAPAEAGVERSLADGPSPRAQTRVRRPHGRVAAPRATWGDRRRARSGPPSTTGLFRAQGGPWTARRPFCASPQPRGDLVGAVVLLRLAPRLRGSRLTRGGSRPRRADVDPFVLSDHRPDSEPSLDAVAGYRRVADASVAIDETFPPGRRQGGGVSGR